MVRNIYFTAPLKNALNYEQLIFLSINNINLKIFHLLIMSLKLFFIHKLFLSFFIKK